VNKYIKLLIILNIILIGLSSYIVVNHLSLEAKPTHQPKAATIASKPKSAPESTVQQRVADEIDAENRVQHTEVESNSVTANSIVGVDKVKELDTPTEGGEVLSELDEIHHGDRSPDEIPIDLLPSAEVVELHKQLEAFERSQSLDQ